MSTVMISGSISVKQLDENVLNTLDSIIEKGHKVIVGDASGVDYLVQSYLNGKGYENVVVYHTTKYPRNIFMNFESCFVPTNGETGREFYAVKDRAMCQDTDFGLVIWDGKSKGSLANIEHLAREMKFTAVYLNKEGVYKHVTNLQDAHDLK